MQTSGTVEKALDLLFLLHAAPAPRGVSELARDLGQARSNVHRLLATLAARDLVEQDGRGRYRLGVGMIALGLGALAQEPLVAVAHPLLEAQAAALGETLFVVAARGGRLVVLDRAEGPGLLRVAPALGSQVPVHATATGRLFLAFAPDRVSLGDGPLERFTPATCTRRAELAEQVARARERAWDSSAGEWIEGLAVVAAPIRCAAPADGHEMVGALALGASEGRLGPERVERVAAALIETADSIAARLTVAASAVARPTAPRGRTR